jgi:triosephosphate isomerase
MEEQDIAPQFAALDDSVVSKCIFCYEPSNDIGGSVTATPEQIKAVKLKVSNFAKTSPFMYGGSVNSDNVGNLLDLGLSGVLVATASLDSASYLSILREVSHAA